MHFFSSPRTARPTVTPAVVAAVKPARDDSEAPPEGCGWYDSSFELSRGLEVTEEDSDLSYQLCRLLC